MLQRIQEVCSSTTAATSTHDDRATEAAAGSQAAPIHCTAGDNTGDLGEKQASPRQPATPTAIRIIIGFSIQLERMQFSTLHAAISKLIAQKTPSERA